MLNNLKKDLRKFADKKKAKILSNFFKTGKGEYGEGDVFLGLKVSESRQIAKKYSKISLKDVNKLLKSKIHEERLTALLILVDKYENYNKKEIVDFYLNNSKKINNWDLVDLSADKILGDYLIDKDKSILYELAKSSNLWERRISMISTFQFIKNNKFDDALKIAEILMNDKQDLIQKAAGWMLKEIGKRNVKIEEEFLDKHYKKMPRTMLRYAIEKFSKSKRKFYLKTEL